MQINIGKTTLILEQGDITKSSVDVIVNAANPQLAGGGGVDGAIHAAGGPQIMRECDEIRHRQGGCRPGDAVLTTAGNLPAKFVIHAVGPVWHGGVSDEAKTLMSAYNCCLDIAYRNGFKTVAFPSISTGFYGYPLGEASLVALSTVMAFLRQKEFQEVRFVLYNKQTFDAYSASLKELSKS